MEPLPLCHRSANAPLFIKAVASSPFYILTLMLLLLLRAGDFFVSVFIIFISSFLSARETPNSTLSSTATGQ